MLKTEIVVEVENPERPKYRAAENESQPSRRIKAPSPPWKMSLSPCTLFIVKTLEVIGWNRGNGFTGPKTRSPGREGKALGLMPAASAASHPRATLFIVRINTRNHFVRHGARAREPSDSESARFFLSTYPITRAASGFPQPTMRKLCFRYSFRRWGCLFYCVCYFEIQYFFRMRDCFFPSDLVRLVVWGIGDFVGLEIGGGITGVNCCTLGKTKQKRNWVRFCNLKQKFTPNGGYLSSFWVVGVRHHPEFEGIWDIFYNGKGSIESSLPNQQFLIVLLINVLFFR